MNGTTESLSTHPAQDIMLDEIVIKITLILK